MSKTKIELYKKFFRKDIWDIKQVQRLKDNKYITSDEYNEIINQPITFAVETYKPEITYALWDKQTPINGMSPKIVIETHYLQNAEYIGLILIDGVVRNISDITDIALNNNISPKDSPTKIMDAYITKLKEQQNAPQIDYNEIDLATKMYNNILLEELINKYDSKKV